MEWAAYVAAAAWSFEENGSGQTLVWTATDPEFGLTLVDEIEVLKVFLFRKRAELKNSRSVRPGTDNAWLKSGRDWRAK